MKLLNYTKLIITTFAFVLANILINGAVLAQGPNRKANKTENVVEAENKISARKINVFIRDFPKLKYLKSDVQRFYSSVNNDLVWSFDGKMSPKASLLTDQIKECQYLEIIDSTPYFSRFAAMAAERSFDPIDFDLMATSQYLDFIRQNFEGQISVAQTRKIDWHIPRNKFDAVTMLNNFINNAEPKPVYGTTQYFALVKGLKDFKQRGLDKLKPMQNYGRDTFYIGDNSPTLLEIRNRLHQWGDLRDNNGSSQYDSSLFFGVQAFQERMGQFPTGHVDRPFMRELNVDGKFRVKQILANLERLRWLYNPSAEQYLLVNIPGSKLVAMEKDSVLWSMRVMTGHIFRRTEIFSGDISYLEFRPYWTVPRSILESDIWPAMDTNANYLKEHDMQRVGGTASRPFLRQNPGDMNPMGDVKFMFPNKFDIYLHDTPDKGKFDRNIRSLSSGCIRLENAEDLATWLLQNQGDWNREKVKQAMGPNGKNAMRVNLSKKMPVMLSYLTAFTNNDGSLQFRFDIYQRDENLISMLGK